MDTLADPAICYSYDMLEELRNPLNPLEDNCRIVAKTEEFKTYLKNCNPVERPFLP